MPPVRNIDVAELQQLRQSRPVVLLDVRTDAEVARGMIAGALHVPLHQLPERVSELDPASTLVVYCQSGGRSAHAAAWLENQGFASVSNLQGGILAWMREGHAVAAPDSHT
jgi:rhodanese-related sulfurtransferase